MEKTYKIYSGGWQVQSGYPIRFVYDGWNPVLVLKSDNTPKYKLTWGLDLSQSIHGAGGIGGLLAAVETQGSTSSELDDKRYWFLYDANGNVGQVLDATDTDSITIAARYEYDPYGNPIPIPQPPGPCPYADLNPFRFSTKWFDRDFGTDLGYWGYRYYSPRLGRWISRDPIGEEGGENLLALLVNQPTNAIDSQGLIGWSLDSFGCTVTMLVKIQLEFKNVSAFPDWTMARQLIFQNLFEMHVRSTFNAHAFRIYPNPTGSNFSLSSPLSGVITGSRCPCLCSTSGWHPRVELTFGWFQEDFLIHVESNPERFPRRSSAQLGGPQAWLDEADVYAHDRGGGLMQIPAVHEFGHLIGLNHPGQDLRPPPPPNSPPDYTADWPALMGAGMEMRAAYFSKWEDRLDDTYRGCRWHVTR